jgi:putative nucleotidyltransferase with HDIG domain
MKILFVGSNEGKDAFRQILAGSAILSNEKDADACIVEISNVSALFKLPKTFGIPTFFYITKKDQKLFETIKEFKISGIFFPPLKKEEVTKKLLVSPKVKPAPVTDQFDTLKAKIIAKAENIPPLPSLAKELVRLTRNDKTKMKDFVTKIKMDQGLSSRIIRLANSPFYGLRQEVASIDRATVLLGINTVKNLALAVSTELFYNKNFRLYHTTGKRLWEHALIVAQLCEAIGKEAGEDEDALYLAGLMHDIGKTVVVDFLVKEVSSIHDERDQLGVDHATIGELILSKWSVTKRITDAVRNHHSLNRDKFRSIVYFSNILAETENIEDVAEDAAAATGLAPDKVINIAKEILIIEEEEEKEDDNTEETA